MIKYPNLLAEIKEHGDFEYMKRSCAEVANITEELFDKILDGQEDIRISEATAIAGRLTHWGDIRPNMSYLYGDELYCMRGFKRSHRKKIYAIHARLINALKKQESVDVFYRDVISRMVRNYNAHGFWTMAEYRHMKALLDLFSSMQEKRAKRRGCASNG